MVKRLAAASIEVSKKWMNTPLRNKKLNVEKQDYWVMIVYIWMDLLAAPTACHIVSWPNTCFPNFPH